MELFIKEKIGIMENEYSISINDKIREDVSEMCNLSQRIREKGIAEGEARVILNMYKKGYTIEAIADISEKSIEEIKAIIEKKEPVLV